MIGFIKYGNPNVWGRRMKNMYYLNVQGPQIGKQLYVLSVGV